MEEILKKIDEEITNHKTLARTCKEVPNAMYHLGIWDGLKKAKEIIQSEQKTNGFSWECPVCHSYMGLDLAKNSEVITNADKIRNMSDEELANVIVSGEVAAICPECAYYGTSDCYVNECAEISQKDCSIGILKWLKQEAR